MGILAMLWRSLEDRFDLDERWKQIKFWLTESELKPQRLAAVAASLLFVTLVVLLLTTCDGGPQIEP